GEGRLIAIYPEGTTHAEARVQRIKTGAARIALAYEAEHPGELRLVPVGLTFEARKSFRGRVLVSFGPPVPVTPYLDAYRRDPVKAVEALTTAIQWAMEAEVVHVERIDATQLVRAVEELYRGELARELQEGRGPPPQADRPDPPLPGHRGRGEPLQGARSGACRAALAADPGLPRPARGAPHQGRGGARTARAAAAGATDSAGLAGRRRLSPFRLRCLRELPPLLDPPLDGAPHGAERDGLRDVAVPRLGRRVPPLWGIEIWLVAWLLRAAWALAFALALPPSGTVPY